MNLTVIDWAIVAAYFLLSAGIGFLYTKKGGESLDEYFLSGRQVPWWLAGASMVATTFAADTPLVVTGLVAANGVAGNWIWWCFVMSGMLTVFFFARLWRRAHVMTDIEFAEIRYSGPRASFLRGFRAIYLGVFVNLIILGWVTKAMIKILTISLGVNPYVAVGICFVITVAYSVAAGMWAVLWTDLVQFVIKMGAVIILAIYSVRAVGGIDAMKAKLAVRFGSEDAALSVLPVSIQDGGLVAYAWLPLIALATFLFVQWWAAWYPGAEPGGGGYVAQRIFSSKTERDGVLATLSFQVAHYAIRPWPWIVTGLATVLLYPEGIGPSKDREAAYVQAYVDLLPTPWRGVMMAGFAAAYMSTVATQLNWGASYLVNDFYRRFWRPKATEAHFVAVSRWATVVLFLLSAFVTWNLDSVAQAWKFLIGLGAGTGLVYILRWYWWRVNAWSEISAMIASFLTFTLLSGAWGQLLHWMGLVGSADALTPGFVGPAGARQDAVVLLVTVIVTTVVWLTTTFMTAPEPPAVLDAFYRRVRPGGPGWLEVSNRLGFGREAIPGGRLAWTNWLAGIVAVYASLFGIGKIIFGEMVQGVILLTIAAIAFAWIARSFRNEESEPSSVADTAPPLAAD
jgi:solute:Na+ symporter, SSS family